MIVDVEAEKIKYHHFNKNIIIIIKTEIHDSLLQEYIKYIRAKLCQNINTLFNNI